MSKPSALFLICGQLTSGFSAKIARTLEDYRELYSLHILFCCNGGELNGGIDLYNTLKKFRGDLTLYVASAKSAGAIALLGAANKKILPHGAVMFHAVLAKIGPLANIQDLRASVESATGDDNQLRAIIRKHLPDILPDEWVKYTDGCFAPTIARLIELGLFTKADVCDFPDGAAIPIFPD